MEQLHIHGGASLSGSVAISGSKNATLPVLAASLLTDQPVDLANVPAIEDIETMAAMLRCCATSGCASSRAAPAAGTSRPPTSCATPWVPI
jgi:UDP-N-acetylglucosamine 1-carboxyvinyltransferase